MHLVRVEFSSDPLGEPLANLWVQLRELDGEVATVELLHDYPDFHPMPGWYVRHNSRTWIVRSVDRKQLTCERES